MKYVAFLRAINVGGHAIIKMTDLKKMFESAGMENVQTYIQSGNVIFETEAMVIFVMVTFNCLISPAIYLLGRTSDISSHMGSPTAVWNSTSIGFVAGQILISVLAVSTALYIQTRKKTFL